MNEYINNEESERVYSHLQIQQKQIDPNNQIFKEINRNLQLGQIDKKEYKELKIAAEKLLILNKYPSILMQKEAREIMEMLNTRLVLSGSVEGFVRKQINTQTNIQKVTQENKGGVLRGIFKRSDSQ
jgi:predicted phosphohydrolase